MTTTIEYIENELIDIENNYCKRDYSNASKESLQAVDVFLRKKGYRLLMPGDTFNMSSDHCLCDGSRWSILSYPINPVKECHYWCRTPLVDDETQGSVDEETEGDALLRFFRTPVGEWKGM